eukprot:TRINITY_DN8684_c0_g1_i1.p1 TRINITY_DN8684_c0_g1~~TRINITY_DN8684_c0_g1_i1.p1  ORF type:complete len:640 (+),score=249.66 TRINITY_DN8684_c0_g1_i1:38-1957(+)
MADPFWNSDMEKTYAPLKNDADVSKNISDNQLDHNEFVDNSPLNDEGDLHSGFQRQNSKEKAENDIVASFFEPILPGALLNPFNQVEGENKEGEDNNGENEGNGEENGGESESDRFGSKLEEDEEEDTQVLEMDEIDQEENDQSNSYNGKEEEVEREQEEKIQGNGKKEKKGKPEKKAAEVDEEEEVPKAPKERYISGTVYNMRKDLADSRIHTPTMAGIWSGGGESFPSIVLSGGYEDDVDDGIEIIYTGQGGMKDGKQVADQELRSGNLVLLQACKEKKPVRVTRGSKLPSPYAPEAGYRYDGLYIVRKAWNSRGQAGFFVWRYRLLRMEGQQPLPPPRTNYNRHRNFKYSGKRKSTENEEKGAKKQKRERSVDRTNETPLMKKLRKELKRERRIRGDLNNNNNNNNNNNVGSKKSNKLKCEFCTRVVEREKMADHLKSHRSKLTKHFEGDKDKLDKRSIVNQVRIRGILEGEKRGSSDSSSSDSDSSSSSSGSDSGSSGSDSSSGSSDSSSSSSDSSDSEEESKEAKEKVKGDSIERKPIEKIEEEGTQDNEPLLTRVDTSNNTGNMDEEMEEPKTPEINVVPLLAQENAKNETVELSSDSNSEVDKPFTNGGVKEPIEVEEGEEQEKSSEVIQLD